MTVPEKAAQASGDDAACSALADADAEAVRIRTALMDKDTTNPKAICEYEGDM